MVQDRENRYFEPGRPEMNIDHMRAFLEVAATGSFQLAADRLNVTQSTVSARIKVLEERLDRVLFNRRRTGAEMTGAGRHFHRYALTAVRAWEQARHEIALPDALSAVLGIGLHPTLWDLIGVPWIERIQERAPKLGVRTVVDFSYPLTRFVADGLVDIAVLYVPQQRTNLKVELLMEEDLIMVSGSEDRGVGGTWLDDYIYVGWGDDFAAQHSLAFPDALTPRLQIDHPALALEFVLRRKATAYLLRRAVEPLIADGALHVVEKAPVFRRPAYIAYPEDPIDPKRLAIAIDELKAAVGV
jgi:DNA-binding transcriptional LysR family regulator